MAKVNPISPHEGNKYFYYILQKQISKTTNSYVFNALNTQTNQNVVVKFIIETDINKEKVKNEILLMKELDCPFIIKGNDFFNIPGYSSVVMDSYSSGEFLTDTKDFKSFSEDNAKFFSYESLIALKYLHERKIMHRDIKIDNFLKTCDGEFILIDLGLATKFEKDKKIDTEFVGTLPYVAPEVLNHLPYDETIDIWSLGVTFYIALSGTHPFPLEYESSLRRCIKSGEFSFDSDEWTHVSKEAKDLISKMIVVDPAKRISIQDALNHPWFKSINNDFFRKKSSTKALSSQLTP